MTAQKRRLDFIINRLCEIRNSVQANPEIEFGIDKLIMICEVAVDALATEIDDEVDDNG